MNLAFDLADVYAVGGADGEVVAGYAEDAFFEGEGYLVGVVEFGAGGLGAEGVLEGC